MNSLTFPPAFTVPFLSKRKIWWLYCLIINTQQCPVSWLYMEYCWKVDSPDGSSPRLSRFTECVFVVHGKTVTADVPSKVNSRLSIPTTSSNIENWWGRDDRWRHNVWYMTSFVQKYLLTPIVTNFPWRKTRKKDVGIVIFELIGLLFTKCNKSECCYCKSHYYYNGTQEFMWKCSMLTLK